ncbi:hypothetical protein CVT26_002238 [Gymnopilus dilepis]|uniref:Uncharacterized protein n=1 Tax=Gymnopilus dilepis TaxID=231916 RepID=A0A409YN15_9AGAR|nr:hypothetical protein CVT26_002238 [Gymnopilus dilepis]
MPLAAPKDDFGQAEEDYMDMAPPETQADVLEEDDDRSTCPSSTTRHKWSSSRWEKGDPGPAPSIRHRSSGCEQKLDQCEAFDDRYRSHVNGAHNRYTLFQSRLDWEIAKWAKLCGLGSMALSKLLAMEGIIEALNLSYKDSDALNKIIDESLPGRPRFVRHEIVADGEAFKFFARDVIECIKALWGDTDFVIDLIFEPMCHYADENRTIRIYHAVHIWQMGHTGKGIHSPIDPILIGDLTEGGLQRGPRTSFPPTRHS